MFLTFEKIPLFVNLNLMGADGNARVHSELINFLYLIELDKKFLRFFFVFLKSWIF